MDYNVSGYRLEEIVRQRRQLHGSNNGWLVGGGGVKEEWAGTQYIIRSRRCWSCVEEYVLVGVDIFSNKSNCTFLTGALLWNAFTDFGKISYC